MASNSSNMANRTRVVFSMLGLVLLAGACAPQEVPAAPSDNPTLVQGQAIYAKNCASCHGGDGKGGIGSRLNGGRVVERYPDEADQIALVTDGQRNMPGFGDKISSDEVAAVVAYVREVIAAQG